MKFLAMLILVMGSQSFAGDDCGCSKEENTAETVGSVQLPVHIKVYTDFTCKYCRIGNNTMDSLILKYGDKIEVEPVAYPLSETGVGYEAAKLYEALKLIDPTKSLDYASALYSSNVKTKTAFVQLAQNLGVSAKKLTKLAESRKVSDILKQNRADAKEQNIKGVPGYILNNHKIVTGARPIPYFENLFGNPNSGDGC